MVPKRLAVADRILVVEDHPLFCEALTMTLRDCLDVGEIATCRNLAEALDTLAAGGRPDAVVLDLNLPDVAGMDGLIRIKATTPSTPVIVVSSLSDNRIIDSVMRNGAAGFVSKDSSRAEIAEAFRTIWAGDVYTPESYQPQEEDAPSADEEQLVLSRLRTLTPQQGRILQSICEGKLNKQIAYDLSIAEATVKAHVTAILRKLGVHSRTQAVLVAQKARFSTILHEAPMER